MHASFFIGQSSSSRTAFRSNPALQRTTLHHIPIALKPSLEPWVASAAPSENRVEGANRIIESWFYNSSILDLTGGLRLRLLPQLNPEEVRTLHVEANDFADFEHIVDLHPECDVHITDINPSQGLRDFMVRVNSPEYCGPRIHFAANVAPRLNQVSQEIQQPQQRSSALPHNAGNMPVPSRPPLASSSRPVAAPRPAGSLSPASSSRHPVSAARSTSSGTHVLTEELAIDTPGTQEQIPTDHAGEDQRSSRAQRFLDAFKKKCDICHQPVKKSRDISLAENSVVHERCLVEEFPRQANDGLEMVNPRRQENIITLDAIEGGLRSAPENDRNIDVYLEIIQRLLNQRGNAIDPRLRMQLLLRAASCLPENTNLSIGSRALTKKDCLILAVELALEHARESVPLISQRLLDEFPDDTQRFLINGVNLARSTLVDWSRNINLSAEREATQTVINVENSMHVGDCQNVHNDDMQNVSREKLADMRQRAGNLMPLTAAAAAIKQYIRETRVNNLALEGLRRVLERTLPIESFGVSITDTLRIVWGYIENTPSPLLKSNLRNALVNRLVELGENSNICAIGIINRLLDTPTAVDFSISGIGISKEQLRAELASMASDINDEFDEEWGRHADDAREWFEFGWSSIDPDIVISEIKRDMFIAKARALYVDLRGLDINMVLEEANKVFPEGTVL